MSRTVFYTIAILFALGALAATSASAQETIPAGAPSAASILERVDANEVYSSIRYKGEMLIEYQGKRFLKRFQAYARGLTDSFVEFTNPEDKGTKYLKKDGRLYVYSPDAEEVMLISGHLLKESMMGSDLSYEDTIDNEKLSARYDPILKAVEEFSGRRAWVLELTAKKRTESYPKQMLWIDSVSGELLRFELFALSGAKLKDYTLIKSLSVGGRLFPVEFEMRDLLRKGSRTRFSMSDVVLDAAVPDSVFSMRNLER